MSVVAVIGGTGSGLFPRDSAAEELGAPNHWGQPSASARGWELSGHRVLFLPRHGDTGSIPPHRVNYRANLQMLFDLGAEQVVALNAVGGIDVSAGALVVPDQLIDYTWGRAHSYYDQPEGSTEFIDLTEPYSDFIRKGLINAATLSGVETVASGTYGVTQGPRLETAAEIRRLRQDGCTLVGMTGMPEAALARELGLAYASLCLVVNPAAGCGEAEGIHAAIEQHLETTVAAAARVISRYIEQL